jgi:Flp pilus assembly pilin Flp
MGVFVGPCPNLASHSSLRNGATTTTDAEHGAFMSMATKLVAHITLAFRRMFSEELGQGLAEYALILLFIGVVAIAALTFLGSDLSSILSNLATQL